LQIQ